MGIPFTVQDLNKPDPKLVQRVFEWLAEVLLNTSRDVVAPAMRAAAIDVCGSNADLADRLFAPDSRDLAAFFVLLQRLLAACGIVDFAFSDLLRPTRDRLVRLLSYIINFIRFRESQTAVTDTHFNRAERTKLRLDSLYRTNEQARQRLAELEQSRAASEAAVRERDRRCAELKQRLLELKRASERVQDRLDEVKARSGALRATLHERTEAAVALRQDAAKLRPYTQQSPAALEAALRDISASLATDRAHLEALDRRSRALQTSADTFGLLGADVVACTRLLAELQADLGKEDEEQAKAARHREALSERSNNVRDVERQERLLQKQLDNITARTEKLRRAADDKADGARLRMDDLKALHKRLADERADKLSEMERRKVKIEQTEKKAGAGRHQFRCVRC